MAVKSKVLGKRPNASQDKLSKKRKLSSTTTSKSEGKPKPQAKGKGKERAYDKGFIEIPTNGAEVNEDEVDDEDLEFFNENVEAGAFLRSLDEKGISRSKKEEDRLHKLNKPVRKAVPIDDDLPSIDSHSEDEEDWSSDLPEDGMFSENSDIESVASSSSSSPRPPVQQEKRRKKNLESEMPYEKLPRKHSARDDSEDKAIERLPIKLQNGLVQRSREKVVLQADSDEEDSSDTGDEQITETVQPIVEDVTTGARFGRPAVIDIINAPSRKARIEAAKEQIAGISQDIISDPEINLGLLRRLINFCRAQITTPSHPEPVENDVMIRKIAVLSAQAVFRDIIPGYRIRALTDKEKSEKVSQMVQRSRDFEQGLVTVYQSYLQILEKEVKAKNELSNVALGCICRLLTDATHFNFRTNLLSAVIAQLSKKSWDDSSELCRKTLTAVFRKDNTGQPSLEAVRLLNRMVKERHFNVHPNVMFCLLDLRLKDELGGIRASQTKSGRDDPKDAMSKGKAAAKRAKGKKVDQPHLSKNARKKKKEIDAIGEEMREAEAEVDSEERQNTHTETLKLLFVLYFRILKNDKPTPLLPAALQGISRFAHLVNIDFFSDLLQVLRTLVKSDFNKPEAANSDDAEQVSDARDLHLRLHCIVTAFELLCGQGEALTIDLTDFTNQLYAMILPLCTMPDIESPVAGTSHLGPKSASRDNTPADMLFRALTLSFSNRSQATGKSPPWRFAAFVKRLATASLQLPPSTTKRALEFIQNLVAREAKLEVLLSTEDRITDGIYRPEVDDPQVSNPFASNLWELHMLSARHTDSEIRRLAAELLSYTHEDSR